MANLFCAQIGLRHADIWAFVAVDFTRAIKEPIPDLMTGLRDWYERVSKRDSAQLKL